MRAINQTVVAVALLVVGWTSQATAYESNRLFYHYEELRANRTAMMRQQAIVAQPPLAATRVAPSTPIRRGKNCFVFGTESHCQ